MDVFIICVFIHCVFVWIIYIHACVRICACVRVCTLTCVCMHVPSCVYACFMARVCLLPPVERDKPLPDEGGVQARTPAGAHPHQDTAERPCPPHHAPHGLCHPHHRPPTHRRVRLRVPSFIFNAHIWNIEWTEYSTFTNLSVSTMNLCCSCNIDNAVII